MHRRRLLAGALLVVAAILAGSLLIGLPRSSGETRSSPEALYYDSLSREYPNPQLRDTIVSVLEEHGYNVTVLEGREAGLEALESLEKYSLIIIRAHGAYNGDPRTGRPLGTYIYTGLRYEEAVEALGRRALDNLLRSGDVALGVVPPPGYRGDPRDLPKYIAVSPQFLERHNHEYARGAIIVFSGCYGAEDERLASVFLERGAGAFIGWRGNVSWGVSDASLEELVRLLASGKSPEGAVSSLPGSLREDPFTGAELVVYEAGG